MPAKIARSSPRPSFGLPELLVATHISRPGFQGRRKIATIHAGLGVIRGMSVNIKLYPIPLSAARNIDWKGQSFSTNVKADKS